MVGYVVSFFALLYLFGSVFIFGGGADSEQNIASLIFVVELIAVATASFLFALRPPSFASIQARHVFEVAYFVAVGVNLILLIGGGLCFENVCVPAL